MPTDADFDEIFDSPQTNNSWIDRNNKWSEWNTGSSIAGNGYVRTSGGITYGVSGSNRDRGSWWSSTPHTSTGFNGRRFIVRSGYTTGTHNNALDNEAYSVRCIKKLP
ncbi:hypothetical protein FACS1894199_12980 [Bacteroidia bacterium]|nr:hypothetical protein FACS1894199_12980 [Bacteroidia bacterium]